MVLSDDEEDLVSEDSSKQGRMSEDIDQDDDITLVTPTKVSSQEDQSESHLEVLSAAKILVDTAPKIQTYTRRRRSVNTAEQSVSTVDTVDISTPSPVVVKDKGKGIMQESEPSKKIKKTEMLQISHDEEVAQKLHAKELARIAARQEQERYDLEKALGLQKQFNERHKNVAEEAHDIN
ncbi:hypothetical protein Tco_0635804 [Tanacetum coccineum]